MRKLMTMLLFSICFFLVACGEEPLTKGEVIEQAREASQEIESYTADINIHTGTEEQQFTFETTSDITTEPETLYMEMDMGMPGLSMDVAIYLVEEEVYMNMLGEWLTTDNEEFGFEDLDKLNEEEIERLESVEEDLEMTEEEDAYVFVLSGKEEEFSELLDVYLEFAVDEEMDPVFEEDLKDEISLKKFEMEMRINKETKLMDTQHIDADFELDGENYEIEVDMALTNVNENEPIELPEEAKEEAINLDEMNEMEEMDADLSYIDEAMPLAEIEEMVAYPVPEVSYVPEGYEMMDSYFYVDDYTEFVYIIYQKYDLENSFIFSVYPSVEAYGGVYEDEWTETVSINGNEGVLEEVDPTLMFLTWEQDDVFLELIGEGAEMTSELLLEIAESVE